MSHIQPLSWQKDAGVAKANMDEQLGPSHGQGRILLNLALVPTSPRTALDLRGSSLHQSSLISQKITIWPFAGWMSHAGWMSCTGSDEHQSLSKVNSKLTGLGARRQWERSGFFFLRRGEHI